MKQQSPCCTQQGVFKVKRRFKTWQETKLSWYRNFEFRTSLGTSVLLIWIFFGLVWQISGHFWGVYQSHYYASDGAFLFSFAYLMYLNIASYLFGKKIKSKLGNKLYAVPVGFVPPPFFLRLCIALFAVAEGWLLLDIGWFFLFLWMIFICVHFNSLALHECITFNFNRERGIIFQLQMLIPFMTTYITYRDLKVKNGKMVNRLFQ